MMRLALLLIPILVAGQMLKLPPEQTGERIVAIVPMIGKGTMDDPIRPKYAPVSDSYKKNFIRKDEASESMRSNDEKVEAAEQQIISYTSQISDDGKKAIVEFVARSKKAFAVLEKDNEVRTFKKSDLAKKDVLLELQKLRKNFDPKDLTASGN